MTLHRKLFLVTSLVGLLLVFGLISCGDDDEMGDSDEGGQAQKADTGRNAEPRIMNDSVAAAVYAQINTEFATVKPIFERSCFDCHSANTHFPWYAKVPLVKSLIESDVKEGRREVDMTNGFPFAGKGTQFQMLKRIHDEIAEGDMPILTYRMMHWGKKIEGAQQDSVFAWISAAMDRMRKASQ